MTALAAYYEAAVQAGEIKDDALQKAILVQMQGLADALAKPSKPFWLFWKKRKPIQGLYLYGPVGAGKTYLMDLFFDQLGERKKRRFHFHQFMQQIDEQLRRVQGRKDPLKGIAKQIAQTTRLLCFDEFLVHDVADAMILAELLPALTAQGVILVISSNTKPEDLYLNGVQRARFLPVIQLISESCTVLFLNERIDYRLGRTAALDTYLYPLTKQTTKKMEQQFAASGTEREKGGFILIQKRQIPFIQKSAQFIWFDFSVLCNLGRSQLDYLEIAEHFDTVFLSGIPQLGEQHTLSVLMLIHLVDVLYDRSIKLVLSAAVPLDELYLQGELLEPFGRTFSRLKEMQSVDYLSRHPKRTLHVIENDYR